MLPMVVVLTTPASIGEDDILLYECPENYAARWSDPGSLQTIGTRSVLKAGFSLPLSYADCMRALPIKPSYPASYDTIAG